MLAKCALFAGKCVRCLSTTLFVKSCRGILVRLDMIPLPFQYSMIMVCTSFEKYDRENEDGYFHVGNFNSRVVEILVCVTL